MTGLKTRDECQDCRPGTACALGSIEPRDCSAGTTCHLLLTTHHSPLTTHLLLTTHYSLPTTHLLTTDDWRLTTTGTFSASFKSATCNPCNPQTFQEKTGQTTCDEVCHTYRTGLKP
jgi:hypothetical protein